jgi:hypothetical protein
VRRATPTAWLKQRWWRSYFVARRSDKRENHARTDRESGECR